MEQLLETLEEILREDKQLLEGIFPYDKGGQLTVIRKYGELLEEEYRENGIYVKAFVPAELYKNLEMNLEKKPSSCQASPLAGPMDILAMEAGGVQRKE